MQVFTSRKTAIHYLAQNTEGKGENAPRVIWAHGWGKTHESFLPLLEPLKTRGNHILLDLPGFGQSPSPPDVWGTEDYADAIAGWMKEKNMAPAIWVGHSFGCRVGLQLAALHPECISALCLIAGAGLKKKRPPHKKLYFWLRIRLFKALRKLLPDGTIKNKTMAYFGSADYNASQGILRSIFIKTINEDLSTIAPSITCPVKLVYGLQDTETPPDFGKRFSALIPSSELFLLEGLDHYTVLTSGRHQTVKILSDLIKEQEVKLNRQEMVKTC